MVIKLSALAIQYRTVVMHHKERVLEKEYTLVLQVRSQGWWNEPSLTPAWAGHHHSTVARLLRAAKTGKLFAE